MFFARCLPSMGGGLRSSSEREGAFCLTKRIRSDENTLSLDNQHNGFLTDLIRMDIHIGENALHFLKDGVITAEAVER